MNSVVLIGGLTRDPEVRYTTSQLAVARLTIAIDRDDMIPEGFEALTDDDMSF